MKALIVPSAQPGVIFVTHDLNSPVRDCTPCRPVLPPDPDNPHGRCCLDCGRVTTRSDAAGKPRCLGENPPFATCTACGEWLKVYRPGQTMHPAC
jgi:hypothetical protein